MLLSYKFRLYPNSDQRLALDRILEIHRQVYNTALKERRHAWKRCSVSIRYTDQANQLKDIRSFDDDVAWCNYSSLQQTLRRLNKAFEAFFRRVKTGETPGYPRFKGRGWFKSVCYVYGDGIKLKNGRLYVQNVGLVRLFQHRPIPDDERNGDMAVAVDHARLHAGLCHALLNEPDEARRMLDAVETESARLLATAFRDAYGQDANLPAALAAYVQAIAIYAPPAVEDVEDPSWETAHMEVRAYLPSPLPVLVLLNRSPALLDQAIGEYGMPIEPHWADLDGDGQDEVTWLEDAAWRAVWVGWQDESGTWQATGIAAGEDLMLETVSPPGEAGRRGVVIRFRGVEQTLLWDGEIKMVLISPDQRPADWPEARTADQIWLERPEAP